MITKFFVPKDASQEAKENARALALAWVHAGVQGRPQEAQAAAVGAAEPQEAQAAADGAEGGEFAAEEA